MSHNILNFPVVTTRETSPVRKVPAELSALASGLMLRCYIHHDRSLVAVLGHGKEHSNHDAIVSWLLMQFGVDAIQSMTSPLDQLTHDLYQYLNEQFNHLEAYSC